MSWTAPDSGVATPLTGLLVPAAGICSNAVLFRSPVTKCDVPVLLYWSDYDLSRSVAVPEPAARTYPLPLTSSDQALTAIRAATERSGCALLLPSGADAKSERVLAVNAATQPLHFAAVHRVVEGLDYFQPGWMVNFAREQFFFRDIGETVPKPAARSDVQPYSQNLVPSAEDESTFLAVTRMSTWRFHAKHAWMDGFLPDLHPTLRLVDTVLLHQLAMPRGLYPPPGIALDDHIRYTLSAQEAVSAVAEGGNVSFLMNAPKVNQLRELVQRATASREFAIQMQEMLPANTFAFEAPELGVPFDGA